MVYRNEIKHFITPADRAVLIQSLRAVARPDPHANENGIYEIRSLYFDNFDDKALREKESGISDREKFRIRLYKNSGYITLEKKVKHNGVGCKLDEPLTPDEARRIIAGDTAFMLDPNRPLLVELYSKMKSQLLHPKTIVDYTRIPFVYGPGNVRVTIDYNIRTGLNCTDFLNPDCVTLPLPEQVILLEVKWDGYLPGIIKRAVQIKGRRAGAFSKYNACRCLD